jgi:hypothetical protein
MKPAPPVMSACMEKVFVEWESTMRITRMASIFYNVRPDIFVSDFDLASGSRTA